VARKLAQALVRVVDGEDGTGSKAGVAGFAVAGKTGTAQKVVNGIYSHNKFYASFIGFAPVEDARVAVVVMFDDPHPNHFGGTVAAPVFQEVVADTLKYLETQDVVERLTKR
jgi:cell division protein FtsI/penicillin-binding protein 2